MVEIKAKDQQGLEEYKMLLRFRPAVAQSTLRVFVPIRTISNLEDAEALAEPRATPYRRGPPKARDTGRVGGPVAPPLQGD